MLFSLKRPSAACCEKPPDKVAPENDERLTAKYAAAATGLSGKLLRYASRRSRAALNPPLSSGCKLRTSFTNCSLSFSRVCQSYREDRTHRKRRLFYLRQAPTPESHRPRMENKYPPLECGGVGALLRVFCHRDNVVVISSFLHWCFFVWLFNVTKFNWLSLIKRLHVYGITIVGNV